MAKNKYDFIKELLEDKRIKQNQRERILELALREISLKLLTDEEIESISAVKNLTDTRTNEENLLPKYLNPSCLYNFLFKYNQNQILRTTCHDIDSNELESILEFCKTETYDFKEHLKAIHDAYAKHEKEHIAPPQVKALIRVYLTGKNYYGKTSDGWSNNIKINWNSEELLEWANENLEIPPNSSINFFRIKNCRSFKIEPQLVTSITERPIQNFTQLVLHFKNLFHIKSGPQSLREIILRVNSEKSWSEKVDFDINEADFTSNLEHFTDVEKLIQAYNKIIGLIVEQHKLSEKPYVKLKYYQENQKVILTMHHFNGVYNKTIENTIERLGQTYASLIKNQINGLCNLHLKADFGNQKFAQINLWNGKDRKSQPIPPFQGVEHIMEFPKIEKL